jgi:hypothetical protein
MAGASNVAWQLEDFVDSLVVELDKTRETLAVKAINKPLSYTVRELALDLNIFPSYDGDEVSFVTAQPGQQGASKVTIQLGTITDQQVRATTKVRGVKDEVDLAEVEVDPKTRKRLRKLGVTSADDIKQIERKNVDLTKVSDNEIDYTELANKIEKAKRRQNPPTVRSASLTADPAGAPVLLLRGANLAVNPRFAPVAVVNEALADVASSSEDELRIRIDKQHRLGRDNEVVLAMDPFAVVRMRVKGQAP